MTAATTAQLAKLEKDMEVKMKEMIYVSTAVEKEDWLNSQVKSMEVNIKVTGVHYRVAEYQKKNAKGRADWRAEMVRRIFVETGVVDEDILFETKGNKKELRRVIKHMHPLGKNRNNLVGPTIIVAFLESSLANDIKERVRKGEGIELTKLKRNRESETIKIFSHLPIILENLRNEALKARRDIIQETGKRVIMNETLRWPWISLYEKEDDKKTPISFRVEDNRLVDPARTLAIMHLSQQRDFVPFHILSENEKKAVGASAMTLAHNPRQRQTQSGADDDMS